MSNLSDLDRRKMDELIAGLSDSPEEISKSEKMRRLAEAGYKRADIARYLDVRYQFVYNVLSAPRPVTHQPGRDQERQAFDEPSVPFKAQSARSPQSPEPADASPGFVWTPVDKGGRIVLPMAFVDALGAGEGDQVQLALDGDVVRVLSRAAALRELQAQVRRFVPEGASLVDELLAERRAEAAKEAEPSPHG